jgi:GNAT superfamily N-acetyltransferase
MIRAATLADIPDLIHIEVDAGELFRSIGFEAVAEDRPTAEFFSSSIDVGHAWIWASETGQPAGFLLIEPLADSAHIEQVSVRRDFAGRGIGATLIDYADHWAVSNGYAALTLTTFRDVPWNAPYYVRLGFRELPEREWSPELRAIVDREADHGIAISPRIAMVKDL